MKKQIYALFTKRQKSRFRFRKNNKFIIPVNRYFAKFHIQGLFFLFAILLTSSLPAQTLEIISPNGGENWLRETDQTVVWINNGGQADLAIEYSTDAGNTWYYLAYLNSSDSVGEYTFLNYMYESDSALLRISYYNDPSVNDVSDATFTVTDPPITVYNPWMGSEFYRTSPIEISWYADSIQTFDLEFSSDEGASWTEIASNISDFNYTFTAPDLVSDDCYVRVSDAGTPEAYALSTRFSITDLPTVNIISPNGGETWNFGEQNEVSWTGSDLPYYLYLELSTDGGNSWDYLGYAYGADTGGTAAVYLPNVNTSQARIKISDPAFDGVSDSSDADFTIFTPPVIMHYPQQGDEFFNQSQTSISWMTTGIDSVNIELSTDNGQSWAMIEENYNSYSNGYYFWTVSGDPSNQCIIKVSDASDPATYGLSEVFTILPTPVISFTSPQNGDIWNTESEYTVSWTYDNPNSYYLYLEYSDDGGQTWKYIGYVPNEDMNGSFQWTTPAIESDQYLLRIADNGLSFVSDTSELFSIKSFPETPICIVSVDEASSSNTIVWEKPASPLIDQFVVYKESESANVFLPIGEVAYDSLATFTDTSSNPAINSYRYKLGFKDASGNLYPAGEFHQTIHLSINQGAGNSWNLHWSPYIGFEVNSYHIYRSLDNENFIQIASLSSSFNSYTDFEAPAGDVYYMVEVVNQNGCDPMLKTGGYGVSRSNIVSSSPTSTEEFSGLSIAKVYPNPANDLLSIELSRAEGSYEARLSNLLGKIVYSKTISNSSTHTHFINTSELQDGIYILSLQNDRNVHSQRVIIKH